MSTPLSFGWVLLLNKSPRGPFSEEEVVSLIQQKIVRPNDMALRISGETKSNWNLLRTYPEFQSAFSKSPQESNKNLLTSLSEAPPTPIVNIEDLPELKAEDLVPRSAKNAFDTRMEELGTVPMQDLPALKRDSPFGLLKRLSPLMGLILLFFIGFEIFGPKVNFPTAPETEETPSSAVKPTVNAAPARVVMTKPQVRLPTATNNPIKSSIEERPSPSPAAVLPPPSPEKSSSDRQDDRSREDKASELADRGNASDDDLSAEDDEEVKPRKRKKVKKIIEEEEYESEDGDRDSSS